MEKKRIIYDFCPRCNGLMKNGCCMACGYEKSRNEKRENGAAGMESDVPYGSGVVPGNGGGRESGGGSGGNGAFDNSRMERLQTPEKTNHAGILIGICIGAALFILILGLAVYLIVNDLESRTEKEKDFLKAASDVWSGAPAGNESGEEDAYAGDDDTDPDDRYVPDAQDEYYVTIVNSLRDDLDYSVEWLDGGIVSENGESSLYALYPQLTGDIPDGAGVNAAIEALAYTGESLFEYIKESDGAFSFYIRNEGYVTYMDENTVSIVFLEYVYINGSIDYFPRIMDLNIDVKTGRVLSHEEMVDYSDALSEKVYRQNQYQNSIDLEEFNWTNAYIGELLQGDDGVAFYTPVGLEVGFNYEDQESGAVGWLTVTVREVEEYGKRQWP